MLVHTITTITKNLRTMTKENLFANNTHATDNGVLRKYNNLPHTPTHTYTKILCKNN